MDDRDEQTTEEQLKIFTVTVMGRGESEELTFVLRSVVSAKDEEAARNMIQPPPPEGSQILAVHIGYALPGEPPNIIAIEGPINFPRKEEKDPT